MSNGGVSRTSINVQLAKNSVPYMKVVQFLIRKNKNHLTETLPVHTKKKNLLGIAPFCIAIDIEDN